MTEREYNEALSRIDELMDIVYDASSPDGQEFDRLVDQAIEYERRMLDQFDDRIVYRA